MGNAERVDVFISYTGRDWGWASWLDFTLREGGYTTKVQGYDFMVGQSFVNAMDEALKQSRLVACLLSPAYLDSRWCDEEWQAALVKEKLLLLRIAECDLDGLLAARAYLDLVGVPEAEARERIVAELKKRDGEDPRPKVKPAFPRSAAQAPGPRFPGSLPAIWNITEERNPYFTGRDQALAELHQALTAGQTAARTHAIQGLGGVGKSQLALEYAFRNASEYDGVWWLHAEEPTTLARDYVALAPKLGVPVVTDEGQMVRQVREQLSQRQRILLIFDNATEPSALKGYLPVHGARQIIVTTRAHDWPDAVAQDVHELPLDAAIAFLLKRTGQTDEAAARDVAQRLGCLPLALEQAAAYVKQCEGKLADYATLLGKHGLDLLERGHSHRYEKTVGTTWALAFEKVQAKCPAAADLLYLCAFLAPEAIYLRDLAGASRHLPERLAKLLADELALDEAKAALLGFSLIRIDRDAIGIHRLVQDVTRKRMDPAAREQWLRTALRTVSQLFPSDSDDVRTWDRCSRWLAHALVVVNWDKAEAVETSACAGILNQTGVHLKSKANYKEAEPLLRRSLAIGEASLGPNHPSVSIRLNNLAELLRVTNRLAEAEPLFRRALASGEASLGPNHPGVATDLNNLALLLQATNRLSEAEPLYRRALAIDEASLGPNHPGVATDLNNLALLLKATNRLPEAEPLYRRALAIDEASLGPNHPEVARNLNNLALLLQATNRLSEAEPLLRRALAINEASLGPNHPEVAKNLNNLAMLLQATNRLSEAEPLLHRAVGIVESSLGPDHPYTLTFRENLELLLAEQGKAKT
jgi:tetratricopeptide (TPR) repeat protein